MKPSLDDLIHDVERSADDPLLQLDTASQLAVELADTGDALLNHFVDRCRRTGHSWADIGEHLGVTRQAVQKRFVDRPPAPTFERFTARAVAALERATDEAERRGADATGSGDLLYGLVAIGQGLAHDALVSHGASARKVQARTRAAGAENPTTGPVLQSTRYTTPAVRVLADCLAVALELEHNYIGTEHLLLAVYRSDNVAHAVLTDLGVDEAAVRDDMLSTLAALTSKANPT